MFIRDANTKNKNKKTKQKQNKKLRLSTKAPENEKQHQDDYNDADAGPAFSGLLSDDSGACREEVADPDVVNSLACAVPLTVPKDAKEGRKHWAKEGADGKRWGDLEEELPEVGRHSNGLGDLVHVRDVVDLDGVPFGGPVPASHVLLLFRNVLSHLFS